jgi:hypothetical protein
MHRTRIALLADRFKLPIHIIAGLTDYQINCIYAHERDKDGIIKIPSPQPTHQTRLQTLQQLLYLKAIDGTKYNELVREMEAKYGVE